MAGRSVLSDPRSGGPQKKSIKRLRLTHCSVPPPTHTPLLLPAHLVEPKLYQLFISMSPLSAIPAYVLKLLLVPLSKTFSHNETQFLRRWAMAFHKGKIRTLKIEDANRFFARYFSAYIDMFPVERTPDMDDEEYNWFLRKKEGVSSTIFSTFKH